MHYKFKLRIIKNQVMKIINACKPNMKCGNEYNINNLSKKLKLNIHQPFLEWKQFNDYNTLNYINLLEYNFPLPNNLFISLVTSKFEIWPKLLNEYSEDIFSLINETNNKRRVHGLNTTGNIIVRKNTSRRKTNKNKYSSKIICKIQFDN